MFWLYKIRSYVTFIITNKNPVSVSGYIVINILISLRCTSNFWASLCRKCASYKCCITVVVKIRRSVWITKVPKSLNCWTISPVVIGRIVLWGINGDVFHIFSVVDDEILLNLVPGFRELKREMQILLKRMFWVGLITTHDTVKIIRLGLDKQPQDYHNFLKFCCKCFKKERKFGQ